MSILYFILLQKILNQGIFDHIWEEKRNNSSRFYCTFAMYFRKINDS